MIRIPRVLRTNFALFRSAKGLLFVLALVPFSEGCSKAPVANERPANTANANQRDASVAVQPVLQPTIVGDIERTSLKLSMARNAVQLEKWDDAASHLQSARKEVEVALTRKPLLRDEFEALKAAIDRAIPVVEGRGAESEERIAELLTRIGAIKVNTTYGQ